MEHSELLVWWASVGVQFHGTDLSWLFPHPRFPAVAWTVIGQTAEEYRLSDTSQPEAPLTYEPVLGQLTDSLARLVVSIARTITDSVVFVSANYLSYDFVPFQRWVAEQSLSLPIFSEETFPGIQPFFVLHELDLQALSEGRGFFAGSNQWLETTFGVGFLFTRRKNRATHLLLESQGVCFAKEESSKPLIDFEVQNWSKNTFYLKNEKEVKSELIRYICHRMLGDYQLLRPFEAMLVPYGDEVREQMLFVHRRLYRDYMIKLIQSVFQVPLVVSWPSPDELKAWDWSLKLPKDIEWISNHRGCPGT